MATLLNYKKISMCLAILLFAGCARNPQVLNLSKHEDDPYEKWNRKTLQFNVVVDDKVMSPIANAYEKMLPDGMKYAIRSVVSNLNEPTGMVTAFLGWDVKRMFNGLNRFLVNTVFGGFGIADFATSMGIKSNRKTFGELLKEKNCNCGRYIVLPILGPTTFRGFLGILLDSYLNPLWFTDMQPLLPSGYFKEHKIKLSHIMMAKQTQEFIDIRVQYNNLITNLRKTSLDFYLASRSFVLNKEKAAKSKAEKSKKEEKEANDKVEKIEDGPSPDEDISKSDEGPMPDEDNSENNQKEPEGPSPDE